MPTIVLNLVLTLKTMEKRRNKLDCQYWKPRGKTTHYCTIDENDPLKRCYGVCKKYKEHYG